VCLLLGVGDEGSEVGLRCRFDEWEVARPETQFDLSIEEFFEKGLQRAFQIPHSDSAIDVQPFNLKEHRIVSRVGIVSAKDLSGSDDSERRTTALQRVYLHRRRLRPQRKLVVDVESILRFAGRMTDRNVERVEIIEGRID